MNEEAKKMYREYLMDKLDLIFNNNGTREITNSFKESYLSNNSNMTILFKKEIVNGKICLLDYNNERFTDEDFDEIGEASHYFVEVKKDGKWNIFNLKKKELVSCEWFDGIVSLNEYLKDNLVLVREDGKQNFLNLETGKTIDNGWHDYIVGSFKNGYVEVLDEIETSGKYYSNLMNKEGNLYFSNLIITRIMLRYFTNNQNYATLELLKNGLVLVGVGEIKVGQRNGQKLLIMPSVEETKRFLVTKDGKELKDLYINDVKEYTDDIILVNNNRFINRKLEILDKEKYDDVKIFKHSNGHVYAIVEVNNNYLFPTSHLLLDSKCNILKKSYCSIKSLDYDSFIIYRDGLDWYIFNVIENKILLNKVEDFDSMWTPSQIINCIVIISNNNGKTKKLYDLRTKKFLIDDEFIDYHHMHNPNYLIVYKKISGFEKGNILDLNSGKLLLDKWQREIVAFDNKKDFFRYEVGNKLVLKSRLKGVEIKKVLNSYVLKKGNEKITLPYLPIKLYGERFILCTNGYNYYLYDKFSKQVIRKYEAGYLKYDDNFLLSGHHEEDKLEFIYENKILDITEYYFKKLLDLDTIKINDNVVIKDEDTFKYMNLQEIERRIKKEKEKNRKVLELQAIKNNEERVDNIKEQEKIRQSEHQELKKQYLQELLGIISKIKELETVNIDERIAIDDLLINKNEFLEINFLYENILPFLDLSLISFKNVKVSGIDFSNTNIYLVNTLFNGNYLNVGLDPQTVYRKDLSNCNLTGIHISPWIDFTGVNIKGACFSSDSDIKTLDNINPTMKDAIYDERTTFNGKPIGEYFEETKKLIK